MTFFLQLVISGFGLGMVYALVALGFVIILKCSKAFNIAQGQFVMIGGYLGYTFLVTFHLPGWLSLLAAIAVAVIMGLLIERLALRPLVGQSVLSVIMMTIALATVLDGLAILIWGGNFEHYSGGLPTFTLPKVGGVSISAETLDGIILAAVVVIILMLVFRYTKSGLAMKATADDEKVVQSIGIKVTTVYAISWVIACVVGVISGILLYSISGVMTSTSNVGLKAFAVVLLGGVDSIGGAIIAGIILGILEQVAAGYLDPHIGGGLANVFPFIVMIVVLIFKPHGLFGTARIERI
jgi:branched-chain amino acid transport system permease protein